MTLQIPTLLALLGTALMAIAIFAPRRAAPPATISFAPPIATVSPFDLSVSVTSDERGDVPKKVEPEWPLLVDPRAAGCDTSTRLALIDALLTVRAPWADSILRKARLEEADGLVRAALDAGLDAVELGT